jgi:hypothetical protein
MRRALVLTDERRRHPFLASLPPHVRQPLAEVVETPSPWKLNANDWQQAGATYIAGFVAISAYIS